MSKGFSERFSEDIYKVTKVLKSRDPVRYKIARMEEQQEKPVGGLYYNFELIKVGR